MRDSRLDVKLWTPACRKTARAPGGDIESDEFGRRGLTGSRADTQNKDARVSAHQ